MTLTVKQKIISLLAEAYELADEISIDGFAYDDGEADEAFDEVRSAINTAMETVNYYADGEGA